MDLKKSILGSGGSATGVQNEFNSMVGAAIIQPDLAKSMSRYQLAVDMVNEAKVRLNLAVCPKTWLMPARMVINIESVIAYNNQLKEATSGMKLGVNDEVNKSTKKVGVTSMSGGPSKEKRPTGHPSDPVNKIKPEPVAQKDPPAETPKPGTEDTAHDKNEVYLIAGAALLAFAVSHYAF